MRPIVRIRAITLGFAVTVTACASPPSADVDSARASVEKATSDGADQYAAESLKAAQDAQAALDAEMKAQEANWFKSYDKTRELAATAKAAGDKAAADAGAAKERAAAIAAREKAAAAERAKLITDAVRVGGKVKAPTKIKDVAPIYPAAAQAAHAAGAVTVEATVGPDGKVLDARVVRSVPLLDQAALDAVKQWEYTPAMLNGRPVPVIMTVRINFAQK